MEDDWKEIIEVWKCERCEKGYEYYTDEGRLALPKCKCRKATVIFDWIPSTILVIADEQYMEDN